MSVVNGNLEPSCTRRTGGQTLGSKWKKTKMVSKNLELEKLDCHLFGKEETSGN